MKIPKHLQNPRPRFEDKKLEKKYSPMIPMDSTEEKKKWTLKEVNKSLKINVKGYGDAIAVAALYKKLYGDFPKIGLSGAQAGMADVLVKKLPNGSNSLK